MWILQPNTSGPHKVRPEHDTTLQGIDPTKAQALALIDLGALNPEWGGHKIPLISCFLNEHLRLKKVGEHTWAQDESFGDMLEWAEPFEGGVTQFEGFPSAESAELVEVEHVDEREAGVWFHLRGEPHWVQSEDAPGSEYIFVGQVASYYINSVTYLFWHPETHDIVCACQFS